MSTTAPRPKCTRCARPYRGRGEWNVTVKAGRVVGHLCPACQSPEENVEAEINAATLEYRTDAFGRLVGQSKGVDQR